jgi:5-methylcytosine-specific restriction endonuclease McrA
MTGPELLTVARSIFILVPRTGVSAGHQQVEGLPPRLKPMIRDHLATLDVPSSDVLVDVLKSVTEQYCDTAPGVRKKRKMSVADLRALRAPFERLRDSCNGRCGVCGAAFSDIDEVHLDHIVPFRLIGDVWDGANWRLLCARCNVGKGEYLSELTTSSAYNWQYSARSEESLRTRWVVLATQGRCAVCGRGPDAVRLTTVARVESHWSVSDLLVVACTEHVGSVPDMASPRFEPADVSSKFGFGIGRDGRRRALIGEGFPDDA